MHPWTQGVNRTSYVRSIYVLCPGDSDIARGYVDIFNEFFNSLLEVVLKKKKKKHKIYLEVKKQGLESVKILS